uniref:TPR repeat-containing protein n=1 Tax=Cyanothece sp. (strain PCC 7425 / ATCC 29141) TaxID=395961 RepID=B8HN02_CYAP4
MAKQDPAIVDTYFFLCNPDWKYDFGDGVITTTKEVPARIRSILSEGELAYVDWSCANTKRIKVGDRAYLLRSGSSPTGIIAAGRVVPAFEDEQLRNLDPRYSDLSAAYVDHIENAYYVCLEFDSVVDFDVPLEQNVLKWLPQFRNVNFQFQGGGKQFAPDNPDALLTLASEWEKHSLIQQSQGKGRRLVDVFLERGDQARQGKDYDSAIDYYQRALEIDPNYAKAINKLKICQSIVDRKKSKALSLGAIADSKPDPPSQPKSPDEPTLLDELAIIRDELSSQEPLSSPNVNEARKRILVSIARRQGQPKFRQTLLEAYDFKCAITGFDAEAALEAAHIIPYAETENNDPSNGLLLRADLHTLFDLNLLAIHPNTMQVFLHPDLRGTEYQGIHEKPLRMPTQVALRPNPQLLMQRVKQCSWLPVE